MDRAFEIMAATDGFHRHLPIEIAHNESFLYESATAVSVDLPWLVLAFGSVRSE